MGIRIRLLFIIFSILILPVKSFADFKSGVLDLSLVDFEETPIYTIDSVWKFHWNTLLSDVNEDDSVTFFNSSASSWTKFSVNGEALPSFGYGTYTARIILPEKRPSLAIYLPKVFSSARMWVDKKEVVHMGKVGASEESTQHRRFTTVVPILPERDTLDIVIQTANFYHKNGGLVKPPQLGTTLALWNRERQVLIIDMTLIGSLAFIGISFLLLFLFYWNRDKAILYFSIFCLCWAYRNLSDGYAPLPHLFDWFPWALHSRMEYAAMFIGGLMGSLFLNSIFKDVLHRIYPRLVTWSAWTLIFLALLLPSFYYTYLLTPFFLIMTANIIYIAIRLLRIISSNQSKLALLAIFIGLFVLSYHMYAFNAYGHSNSIMISIGYIAVFMLNSLLLGKRFSISFTNLKSLQEKTLEQNHEITAQADVLNELNNTLEAKVSERTNNLKEVAKELDILLYRSSHDLKRPLSTISGLTHLGSKITKKKEIVELFEKIEDSNQSMHSLIRKLGQVMLIREHQVGTEEIDSNTLFAELEAAIRQQVERNDMLCIQYTSEGTLLADAFLCKTILHQLLLNSARWVDTFDQPIQVTCKISSVDSRVTMEVSDNGPGIEKELLDGIFEMYQVANDQIPGHGMGLYLVSKAVDKLNGSIEIKSEKNASTRCIVTFKV